MNRQPLWQGFPGFAIRVIIIHMLTYFTFGILASNIFDYQEIFKQPVIRDFMLPMTERNMWLGPFLQPVRGLVFAIGLWPIRGLLLEKKRSWLILWGLLVTIGIISTPAAAPSSLEGMLFSRIPMWYHLMGLPEICLQTLLFSIWLIWWERQTVRVAQPQVKQPRAWVSALVRAIMAACFAYMGYAVGGLLLVAITNARTVASGAEPIDVAASGANFKMQFMFIVAFLVNVGAALWVTPRWMQGQLPLWALFGLFWLIDALVPWVYQTLVFGGSDIPTVFMLGLFPAIILTLGMWLSYRKRAADPGRPIAKSA